MEPLLNYKIYGERNTAIPPLYILHGIFGMLDNWHYAAQQFSKNAQVISLDARNHGKSFHHPEMGFELMAKDIVQVMEHEGHEKIDLMGHSMGGKTAMVFAKLFPFFLRKLIVVDIAPKAYRPGHLTYFEAFETLPLQTFHSRAEADKAFVPFAPEMGVRQFLLKNLEPLTEGGYTTKFNLKALRNFYEEIIGDIELNQPTFTGPTLFIKGEKSGYIKEKDHDKILTAFPLAEFQEIPSAGHWVHADNPSKFIKEVEDFLYHS